MDNLESKILDVLWNDVTMTGIASPRIRRLASLIAQEVRTTIQEEEPKKKETDG